METLPGSVDGTVLSWFPDQLFDLLFSVASYNVASCLPLVTGNTGCQARPMRSGKDFHTELRPSRSLQGASSCETLLSCRQPALLPARAPAVLWW